MCEKLRLLTFSSLVSSFSSITTNNLSFLLITFYSLFIKYNSVTFEWRIFYGQQHRLNLFVLTSTYGEEVCLQNTSNYPWKYIKVNSESISIYVCLLNIKLFLFPPWKRLNICKIYDGKYLDYRKLLNCLLLIQGYIGTLVNFSFIIPV